MVQAARRQDDGEFVTRGEFREAMSAIDKRFDELQAFITNSLVEVSRDIVYNRNLYEMILDDVRPAWRNDLPSP